MSHVGMKYELEPYNRNCSDEVLLGDLKSVAQRLGQSRVTRDDYERHGRFSHATISRRFGSWNAALEKAGLGVQKRNNIPSEELLADLKTVAKRLGKSSLTSCEYSKHGSFSVAAMQSRFGSWNVALVKAGLAVPHRKHIPRDEMLAELKRVANFIGGSTVTIKEFRLHGSFGDGRLTDEFGSWANALAAAGLQPPVGWKPKTTDEELLENMARVWEHVGRQPRLADFRPPVSRFSHAPYVSRYGSWRKALEAFVAVANCMEADKDSGGTDGSASGVFSAAANTETEDEKSAKRIEVVSPEPAQAALPSRRKTPRNPSWRLKFFVMRRDNFKCCCCGKSPALEPGLILEVDHKNAWESGGETLMNNLQTLCRGCNRGKSNLPMHA